MTSPRTKFWARTGNSSHAQRIRFLVYLFQNRGKVITHRTLLGAIWGGNYTEQTEYLRVFIGQLRKKIETDPAPPQYILTEPWLDFATKNLYELFINRLRYPYILGLTL